jgi:hypothetical protein
MRGILTSTFSCTCGARLRVTVATMLTNNWNPVIPYLLGLSEEWYKKFKKLSDEADNLGYILVSYKDTDKFMKEGNV